MGNKNLIMVIYILVNILRENRMGKDNMSGHLVITLKDSFKMD